LLTKNKLSQLAHTTPMLHQQLKKLYTLQQIYAYLVDIIINV